MPTRPLKDWFRLGVVQTKPSYELVQQNELPTVNEASAEYAQQEKAAPPRRNLYRILAAILFLTLGLYLIQTQGNTDEVTRAQDQSDRILSVDEFGADFTQTVDDSATASTYDANLDKERPAEQDMPTDHYLNGEVPDPMPLLPQDKAEVGPTVQESSTPPTTGGMTSTTQSADATAAQVISATSSAPTSSAPASSASSSEKEKPKVQHDHGLWIGKRKLHLLVPSTDANPYMCRTLFTAATMGFPTPALINWGAKPKDGKDTVSHLEKVAGITNYLKALGPDARNDLALITDAYDVWFNLPAQVLVSRYDRVIAEENEYVSGLWGPAAVDEGGMRATTVFAADKSCFGFKDEDFECYLHPDSSLPTDLYGNLTDVEYTGYYPHSTFRPRFLNSGIIMGPVSELLAIFERAEDYMAGLDISPEHDFWQSDQRILIMVLAAQQLARTRKALKHPEWLPEGKIEAKNRTAPHAEPRYTPNLAFHPEFDQIQYKKIKIQAGEDNGSYEHGMVMDYAAAISHTTTAADHEWAYVNYSPAKAADRPKLQDVRDCAMHLSERLPTDIAEVPVPYASVVRPSGPAPLSWDDVSLYTNLCTGEVPVIIHHNGDKSQRDKQWPSLWFSEFALDILAAARNKAAAQPKLNINTGGAITDHGSPLSWEQLCKSSEQKMFVDDYKEYLPGATQYGVPPDFFDGRRHRY